MFLMLQALSHSRRLFKSEDNGVGRHVEDDLLIAVGTGTVMIG